MDAICGRIWARPLIKAQALKGGGLSSLFCAGNFFAVASCIIFVVRASNPERVSFVFFFVLFLIIGQFWYWLIGVVDTEYIRKMCW